MGGGRRRKLHILLQLSRTVRLVKSRELQSPIIRVFSSCHYLRFHARRPVLLSDYLVKIPTRLIDVPSLSADTVSLACVDWRQSPIVDSRWPVPVAVNIAPVVENPDEIQRSVYDESWVSLYGPAPFFIVMYHVSIERESREAEKAHCGPAHMTDNTS